MGGLPGFDWSGYFRSLEDRDVRALATWLAAEGLDVGELMEVVDRSYAEAPGHWRGQSHRYLAQVGRLAATLYARRKRRFAALMATLEEALISGALPGDVAPGELRLPTRPWTKRREPGELISTIERVRHGEA
jgi:hypothetical protein